MAILACIEIKRWTHKIGLLGVEVTHRLQTPGQVRIKGGAQGARAPNPSTKNFYTKISFVKYIVLKLLSFLPRTSSFFKNVVSFYVSPPLNQIPGSPCTLSTSSMAAFHCNLQLQMPLFAHHERWTIIVKHVLLIRFRVNQVDAVVVGNGRGEWRRTARAARS